MPTKTTTSAIEMLRRDAMMAHLMDSLDDGKDIGHYGRLVFAIIARHFLSEKELVAELGKDNDFSPDAARELLDEIKAHDYNPPRREKILNYQSRQGFPIIPDSEDPDCGNVYRSLEFPDEVYDHISEYREQKAEAAHTG